MTNKKQGFPQEWTDSAKVHGVYMGVAYQGQLDCSYPYGTRGLPHGKGMIFVVELAEPITVYGSERKRVEIWTSGSDTLQLS
jgi:hypothetical protein